jgi:hypothetical protein
VGIAWVWCVVVALHLGIVAGLMISGELVISSGAARAGDDIP